MRPKLLQVSADGRLSRPQLWLVGTVTLDAVVLLFGVYLATRPAGSGCPELPERFGPTAEPQYDRRKVPPECLTP